MTADFLFGEKRHRGQRAQDGYVEPGDVIGDDEAHPGGAGVAAPAHLHTEAGAEEALKEHRPKGGEPPLQKPPQMRRRARHKGEGGERYDKASEPNKDRRRGRRRASIRAVTLT